MDKQKILTDGEIKNLYKVISRPGWINPNTNVANLGIQVSLRDEKNLKLESFFLKHKVRNRRGAVSNNITVDNMRLFRELKESVKEHKHQVVYPVIDAKNWPKTMESLEEYLRGHIGGKGVPLSYVVRSKEAVAPSLEEPETSFLSAKD